MPKPLWAAVGQLWPNCQHRLNLADSGHVWADVGQSSWLILAIVGPASAKLGQSRALLLPHLANFGQLWPTLAKQWQTLEHCQTLERLRPSFSHTSTTLRLDMAEIGPTLTSRLACSATCGQLLDNFGVRKNRRGDVSSQRSLFEAGTGAPQAGVSNRVGFL